MTNAGHADEAGQDESTLYPSRDAGSFLKEPEALTNDQVMELLHLAFCQEPVKEAL